MEKIRKWILSFFVDEITINQQTGEGIEHLPKWWRKMIEE